MSPLLNVQNISRRFDGLQVLHDVSFQVPEKAITGLIGPNGAGKSTLFNIVSGFLPPSSGEIEYAGERITRHTIQQRSESGLMRSFQTPQVFGSLTVWENLLAGCHKLGRTGVVEGLLALPAVRRERRAASQAAQGIIEEFGLASVSEQLAGQLPAGKQRIVELARAAIAKPRLLCLDEPSSGLSGEEVQALMTTIVRMNKAGITILLVSHDMELMSVSDRIHVLCFGEIIATGNLSEVQVNLRVREAYLGV
jgi:ABC-type branched-subunit amino acid transport system ATPase component